jgi:hypothetical protein
VKTLPATISENARGGTPLLYLVEVLPRGADSWSPFRWGEEEVTVDGDTYEGGILSSVTQIRDYANIIEGGGSGTRDAVTITLENKNALHNTLQATEIKNRDIKVSLIAKPTNLVKNSSFEEFSGDDFDYWTETVGDGSNSIIAGTAKKTDGSYSVFMICAATPGPTIESNTFQIRAGAPLTVSFDAAGLSSGYTINCYVKIDGKYWNDSTGELQSGAVARAFTMTDSMQRFTLTAYDPDYDPSGEVLDCSIILEVPNTSENAFIDAVVAEGRNQASSYHRHKDEMTSSEVEGAYYGEVDSVEWDRWQIKFHTKSITSRRHRNIPITILNESIDSDWIIPTDNIGTPFPMTYGVFSIDPRDAGGWWEPRDHASGALGILCNIKDGNKPVTVHFDRPTIKMKAIDELYHFNEDGGQYIPELYDDRATPIYVQREWVKAPDNAKAYAHADAGFLPSGRFPLSIYLRGTIVRQVNSDPGIPQFSNASNAFDGDFFTVASLGASSDTGDTWFHVLMENIPLRSSDIYEAFVLLSIYYTLSGGTMTVRGGALRNLTPGPYYNQNMAVLSSVSGTGSFGNIPWATHGQKETAFPYTNDTTIISTDFWSAGGGEALYELLVTLNNATGSASVREIGQLLHSSVDLVDANIYARATGREYQDTWGGRKTAGDEVKVPPDIVESILRDELDVAAADINTTKFDAVNTALSGKYAAGQVVELEDSLRVVDRLSYEWGMLHHPDTDGKEAIYYLQHGSAVAALSESDFEDKSIKCNYASDDYIFNDFIIRYGYNPTSGEYSRSLYCNKDGQNIDDSTYMTKCQNSYDAIRQTRFKEILCKWVNGDNSAKWVMKWFIDWTYLPRLLVEGTAFLDSFKYEIGDRLQLDFPNYLKDTPGDADAPVFVLFDRRLRKSEGRIVLRFLEVKEP